MNPRLPTIFDDLFPDSSPEFGAIADAWPMHVVMEMLTLVWDAFDQLRQLPSFSQLDFSRNYAQLERSLTHLHAVHVTDLYAKRSGFESFVPHHEPWEFDNLTERSARPTSSDIGFVLRANPRLCWSVEAKVLKEPADTDRYVDDLNKYLDGTSSPFTTEAALGAYLITGKAEDVFTALATALELRLGTLDAFASRPHRFTEHEREKSTLPKATPTHFVCHHLVFSLS